MGLGVDVGEGVGEGVGVGLPCPRPGLVCTGGAQSEPNRIKSAITTKLVNPFRGFTRAEVQLNAQA